MRPIRRQILLTVALLTLAGTGDIRAAICGAPSGQQLDFNFFGDFGTIPQQMWSFQLTPAGGTPPYAFSLAAGANDLPGFRISNAPNVPGFFSPNATGAIYGAAPLGVAVNTPFTTTVQLTDCAGTSISHPITIRFSALDFNVQYLPAQISEGQAFSIPLSGIGGQAPYSITLVSGSLPSGVSLNTVTNTLEGTPAAGTAGNTGFSLQIQDSLGATFQRFFGFQIIPLRVLSSRVIVATAGQPLDAPFVITGGTPPYDISLDLSSTLPSGVFVTNGALQGTPTFSTNGFNYYFRIKVTDSAPTPRTAYFTHNLNIKGSSTVPLFLQSNIGVSANRFTDATRASYSANTINIGGGTPPYNCALSPGSTLPAGLLIHPLGSIDTLFSNPTNCFVIGSTMLPGDYAFSVRATDSLGNFGDFPASLHVSNLGLFNLYLPVGTNFAYLNQPHLQPILPFGGTPPYTITRTVPYPVGLDIATHDLFGTLMGTPLEASPFLPLSPMVSDSAGNVFNSPGGMTVNAGQPIITLSIDCCDLPSGTTGNGYYVFLHQSGPVHFPPYTVTLLADPSGPQPARTSLPNGLSLLTSGFDTFGDTNAVAVISGTPNEAGDFSYLLNIQDAHGNAGQRAIRLHVAGASQSTDQTANVKVTSTPFTYSHVTQRYSGTVKVTNISASTLPGPLSAVLTQLPAGVTATNTPGSTPSGPVYGPFNSPMPPGGTLSFPVQFTDPSNIRLGFVLKLYTGQPQ